MRFRFLHAADLHLDTPFTRLAGVPDHLALALRDASLASFDRLVETAIAESVAFVVIAGDIYDGTDRGVRAQLAFRAGLARLDEAGISTFVVYGNHDPIGEGWSAFDTFPERVTVFGSEEVETVEVLVDDVVAATVSGISFSRSAETENLAARFPKATGKGFHIALLHANAGSQGDHDPYSPCSLDDLRATGHDYWALGHIHRRAELGDGHPLIVYPGNLQGRSPKPSERGPKGAVIVDVDGKNASTRFVPLDTVRFEGIEVAIDGLDLDGLEAALLDAIDERQAQADGRPLVVRGHIGGTGTLHDDLAPAERRAELLMRLRDLARNRDSFVWWDELSWSTRPVIDVAERASGDDFIADLLREVTQSGPHEDWVPGIGVEYRNWLGESVPRVDDPELWDEAVNTALVALLDDS